MAVVANIVWRLNDSCARKEKEWPPNSSPAWTEESLTGGKNWCYICSDDNRLCFPCYKILYSDAVDRLKNMGYCSKCIGTNFPMDDEYDYHSFLFEKNEALIEQMSVTCNVCSNIGIFKLLSVIRNDIYELKEMMTSLVHK